MQNSTQEPSSQTPVTPTTYIRVRLRQVPEDLEDPITQHCFDHGASGVSEALEFIQPDLTYDPKILNHRLRELDVYFETEPEVAYFDRLTNWHKAITWQIFEEQQKDWLEEWKKDFKPFALVEPYWIVPSWCQSPVDDKHSLRIDPGMAFGTGTHATTQLASNFLAKRAQKMTSPATLLDVGTGTAVLAILGARMGYAAIVGLEIDPEARRVARENVERNLVPVDVRDELLEEHHKSYDVVVANIIDGVLINLKKPLLNSMKIGGDLFVTGILVEREDRFNEGFVVNDPDPTTPQLEMVRRWQNDEWVGYWLRRIS